MKHVAKLLFCWGFVLGLSGCFEAVEFSDIPEIEFKSIDFVDVEFGRDSLILVFEFRDGDGNIGLGSNEIFSPYHTYSFVLDNGGDLVTLSSDTVEFPIFSVPVSVSGAGNESIRQLDLANVEFLSDSDIRPPFSCEDYEILGEDTLFTIRNEFHHNIHIEFQEKVGEDYLPIDFTQVFQTCGVGVFDGRIPIFDPSGQEGVITYVMPSVGFEGAFLDKTIRIEFFVIDRDLNRSNVEFSNDFTLFEF